MNMQEFVDSKMGKRVFLFYRNLPLEGFVRGIHLIEGKGGIKVKYDVELSFYNEKWEINPVTTRIYNVDSAYVSDKKSDLVLIHGVEQGMLNFDEAFSELKTCIKRGAYSTDEFLLKLIKDLESRWQWLAGELHFNYQDQLVES